MSRLRVTLAVGVLCLGVGSVPVLTLSAARGKAAAGAAPSPEQGVLLSDMHFDPLAPATYSDSSGKTLQQALEEHLDTTWDKPDDSWKAKSWDAIFKNAAYPGTYSLGKDTNYKLMTSALEQSGKTKAKIVIYTGDLMPHDFEASQAFKATTLVYGVQKLQNAFHAPVIVAVGNNDSLVGDYATAPYDPTFALLARHLDVVRNAKDPAVRADFLYGGFYVIPDPSVKNQDIVVLNTSFWSAKGAPAEPPDTAGMPIPGEVELWWLRSKLSVAQDRGRQVRLVMHIPPGADAYASHKNKHTVMMWADKYQTGFVALMRQFKSTVITSFAGHTHQDDFRVLSDQNGTPFQVFRINPSVTTSNYNNPAYSVFAFDKNSGAVSDITTYFLAVSGPPQITNPFSGNGSEAATAASGATWGMEYSFDREYSVSGFSAPNLQMLTRTITAQASGGQTFQAWQSLYNVSASRPAFPASDGRWYSCAQTAVSREDYDACTGQNKL